MKTFNIFIIISLIFLNIILLGKYKLCQREGQNELTTKGELTSQLQYYKYLLLFNFQYNNEPINLNTTVISLDSIDTDTLILREILHPNKNRIIFRFSYLDCQDCINKTFSEIDAFRERMDNCEIVILSNFENIDDFIAKNKVYYKHKYHCYYLLDETIGISVDTLNIPYLAFINKGFYAEDILPIDNFNSDLIKDFLNSSLLLK